MFYSIDRFEENFAVLISDEDGSSICIQRKNIPQNAREGSILLLQNNEYIYDQEETSKRRKALFQRTKKLSKK